MSLLGTLNPNVNPERTVRGQWGQESQDVELEELPQPGSSRLERTASLSTAETALERHDQIGDEDVVEEEVTRLARRLSTRASAVENVENPFLDAKEDPNLDPHSSDFKPRKWMKNLLAVSSRNPQRYPARVAGVAFRNLSVHGFGSPTDYQKDVANSVLEIGSLFRAITGTGKQKIQILRNFDGLVKSGEMLVVLGRPGRYGAIFDDDAEAR
jgi:ATP-binding cassette subfamily G (WHITE) protein 2 (PDR)